MITYTKLLAHKTQRDYIDIDINVPAFHVYLLENKYYKDNKRARVNIWDTPRTRTHINHPCTVRLPKDAVECAEGMDPIDGTLRHLFI